MVRDIQLVLHLSPSVIIEAEFYDHDMNFAEIMHFFRTEDIQSEKTITKYTKLWMKSQGDPELGWPFPGRDLKRKQRNEIKNVQYV